MIVRAKNWRGTAIRAIAGTRGLSGRRRGVGDTPDTFSAADIAALVGPVGPDANQVAALQVGNLAQQIASSGQYSVNPSTGQLQQNAVPGISNQTLIYGGLAALGLVVLLGVMKGGRR